MMRNIETSRNGGDYYVFYDEVDEGRVYYIFMDLKSVGSLNFLGKQRVCFPITNEHSSLAVFTTKFEE